MDDTKSLRRAIEALAPNHYRRRYPAELKARITAHARAELSRGTHLRRVATLLGMGFQTLERFLEEERPAALLPVRVIDPVTVARAPPRLMVRGGCGVTVEGLDLEGIAALLRALS